MARAGHTIYLAGVHTTLALFSAVRTRFDHVLSKFSGFSWERILFL